MMNYFIHFFNNLDPNGSGIDWPNFTPDSAQLLEFADIVPLSIVKDDFRVNGTDFLTQLSRANPL
jgi:hypothetical protein